MIYWMISKQNEWPKWPSCHHAKKSISHEYRRHYRSRKMSTALPMWIKWVLADFFSYSIKFKEMCLQVVNIAKFRANYNCFEFKEIIFIFYQNQVLNQIIIFISKSYLKRITYFILFAGIRRSKTRPWRAVVIVEGSMG